MPKSLKTHPPANMKMPMTIIMMKAPIPCFTGGAALLASVERDVPLVVV